jgi:glycosyltransferase involved in cell wall biosynthesis
MKLLIAIPAYNEEQSIEPIIQRSLAAREYITSTSPVEKVDISVVSDGSTDRTLELAQKHNQEVNVIALPQNRGYGAAIQAAWGESDADLLGFLDADGTCDPRFFSNLCCLIESEQADVVLGCRLNKASQMPIVRRLGNVMYATLLGLFSSSKVRDTASGMRVVRRQSLHKLEPLPDGMHFTPAMSARAMLDRSLKIREIDMPYAEREGHSKLSLLSDGLRFFRVILEAAFLYRPQRPFGFLGLLCAFFSVALMLTPIYYYSVHRAVAEWMIYRFVVGHLAGIAACLLFSTSYITSRIVAMTLSESRDHRSLMLKARGAFESPFFWAIPIILGVAGGWLVLPSFFQLVKTGATFEHWSRFIAMSFLWCVALILVATRACDYMLSLLEERLIFLRKRAVDRQGKLCVG